MSSNVQQEFNNSQVKAPPLPCLPQPLGKIDDKICEKKNIFL